VSNKDNGLLWIVLSMVLMIVGFVGHTLKSDVDNLKLRLKVAEARCTHLESLHQGEVERRVMKEVGRAYRKERWSREGGRI
jgi:hypothetical protein